MAAVLAITVAGCSAETAEDQPTSDGVEATGESAEPSTGTSGDGAEPSAEPSTEAVPAASSGPGRLVDASAELGIDQALIGIRGHAVAVADVDADGWDDVFVGTFADRPIESYRHRGAEGPAPDQLLYGSADGFRPAPDFEGRLGRTAGAIFADLDGDGDDDLVVSRNVRDGDRSSAPSEIYRNDDGVLVPASVLDDRRGGRAIGVIDLDGDDQRDLVLVEDRWSGASTGIFRNEGDLRFREVNDEVGFPTDVWGLGVDVGDLDGDGDADLVVGGSNRWFLWDDGRFTEGTSSPLPWALAGDEDDPAHVDLTDLDGDGDLDVLIGQHFNSTIDADRPEPVRVYLNDGPGGDGHPRFRDATEEAEVAALATKSPRVLTLDLDADGRTDLITTSSSADEPDLPVVLYQAEAEGGRDLRFVTADEGTDRHYWIDAALLDANGDGRTDVFLVEWEPELGARLLLNVPS